MLPFPRFSSRREMALEARIVRPTIRSNREKNAHPSNIQFCIMPAKTPHAREARKLRCSVIFSKKVQRQFPI